MYLVGCLYNFWPRRIRVWMVALRRRPQALPIIAGASGVLAFRVPPSGGSRRTARATVKGHAQALVERRWASHASM